MTTEKMMSLFNEDRTERRAFGALPQKRSDRPDLHAFLLLDALVPGSMSMLPAAEHNIIYLSVTLDDLAEIVTEGQIAELSMCGVFIDEDSLAMFA